MSTPLQPASATVGTTSTEIVAANQLRSGLSITNKSTSAIIHLGLGTAALADKGEPIYPLQKFEVNPLSLFSGAVYAISTMASTPVSIQEYNT